MKMSFKYRFESAHRFVFSDRECATPHGHTWYATLNLIASAEDLNEDNMIEDFAVLKKGWKEFITKVADHSFFHNSDDPILSALKTNIPNFRGLPFPGDPTTEMIAGLFFIKASALCEDFPVRPYSVLIEETPTNSIEFFQDELEDFISKTKLSLKTSNWWASTDPFSRSILGNEPKESFLDL
jgi:6-pyruvoyl-tetrahydropterin synthase